MWGEGVWVCVHFNTLFRMFGNAALGFIYIYTLNYTSIKVNFFFLHRFLEKKIIKWSLGNYSLPRHDRLGTLNLTSGGEGVEKRQTHRHMHRKAGIRWLV